MWSRVEFFFFSSRRTTLDPPFPTEKNTLSLISLLSPTGIRNWANSSSTTTALAAATNVQCRIAHSDARKNCVVTKTNKKLTAVASAWPALRSLAEKTSVGTSQPRGPSEEAKAATKQHMRKSAPAAAPRGRSCCCCCEEEEEEEEDWGR